ncbi:MAG: hypothetical protein WD533_01825, partial [Dehalococcoidia bacterium]
MSAAGRVLAPSRSGMLWERFVSGSGLTIALVLAVLLAVTWPIFEARWVALPIPVPLVAVGGLALAAYVVLSNAHAYQGHMFAVIIGGALALVAGMAVVDGGDSGERLRALFASLAAWVAAVPTDEVRQGIPEFAVFITALAWVLGYLGGWWVLRARTAWPLVLLGALVLLLVLSNVGTGATLRLALFMAASALLLIHVSTIRRLSIWRDKR